jgi:putative endonuclease
MEYFVYILESEVDGRRYKGETSDLIIQIKEGNSGETKSTKWYRPWELVYFETFKTREAVLREKYFKTGGRREFLK